MITSLKGSEKLHLSCSSSIRDVNYSCGSCGYELHLNSSNRLIDYSNYGKSIKTDLISFFSVDESRFTHKIQQFPLSWSWLPFFNSNNRQRNTRTKLLCHNCGVHLGYARGALPSNSWDGISDSRIFYIKLNALQPSFYDDEPTLAKYHSASSSLLF